MGRITQTDVWWTFYDFVIDGMDFSVCEDGDIEMPTNPPKWISTKVLKEVVEIAEEYVQKRKEFLEKGKEL